MWWLSRTEIVIGMLQKRVIFSGQDLFITYGGMGDGGGVALYTNAVPEPTTVLVWSMLAGLGMTVRRRRSPPPNMPLLPVRVPPYVRVV